MFRTFSLNRIPIFWVLVGKSFFCMSSGVGSGGDFGKIASIVAATELRMDFFILSLYSNF